MAVMGLVLFLPFLSRKVEEELETFLFLMGVVSVTISGLWSWHLVKEALIDPITISLAVFVAGLIFRALWRHLPQWTRFAADKFGHRAVFFVIVVVLGLLSSVVTAIIAALILAEVLTTLDLPKKTRTKLAVIACFAIGLGAALTPVGEPLATIAVSRLKGAPHNADFLFLFNLLGKWIIPLILILGIYAVISCKPGREEAPPPSEMLPDSISDVTLRTIKVYIFVLSLVLLGKGFTPVVDRYLVKINPCMLYWINIVSAILDNATLTAAEITPAMSAKTIEFLLAGLLIAGGMLIPGNIPNIICAKKLSIKSTEWAVAGVPLGMVIMILFFIILCVFD